MVFNNFSKYDIDIENQTVYSMSFNKKRPLIMNTNSSGYKRCAVTDDLGNKYYFWYEVLYCIINNTTKDKIPYGENCDRYEIDHIIPVREGGTDDLSNLRLVTHKENMNNEHTKEHISKIRTGKNLSDETKKKISEGNKGKKLSEESKLKISNSNKGKQNWLGKHHSEDTKKKISDKLKGNKNFYGKKHSDETKKNMRNRLGKQVFQYSSDGELIAIWPSAAEAGRNGYNKEAINHCCEGINKTHKGFIWKHSLS